jgi:hypothetical protein
MLKLVPRWALAGALALLVAGLILFPLTDTTTGDTIAFALVGLGGILLASLAFYAVGRSEDLEREREQQPRR